MPRRKNMAIRVTIREKDGKTYLRFRDPVTNAEQLRQVKGKYPSEWAREAGAWERELQEAAGQKAAERSAAKKAIEQITWKAFLERYQNEHLSSLAESTSKRFGTVRNSIAAFEEPRQLADIDASYISRYQAHLRKTVPKETTIASHLAHLRAALEWGLSLGFLAEVPKFPRVKRARKGRKNKPMKGRPISPTDFAKFLEHVGEVVTTGDESIERWKRFINGLYWSGLRLEEALSLHWTRLDKMRVDLDSGAYPVLRILAETEKGNQDRTYPIAPEFAAFLRETPIEKRDGYVFPLVSRFNRKTVQSQQVSLIYASAMLTKIGKSAELITNVDPVTGKPHYAGAHDLRRAFGTRWSRRVLPQILQHMMRHETIETTLKYYVEIEAEDLASDIWKAWRKTGESVAQRREPKRYRLIWKFPWNMRKPSKPVSGE